MTELLGTDDHIDDGKIDGQTPESQKKNTIDISTELTQEQFDTVLDELKTKSLVVDKLLGTEKFVLDKDTFETLHGSNNPNSDPAFWNTKKIEFTLTCKNLYDFLNKNNNRSKLQTYLKSQGNNDANKIREIKNNLDQYCQKLEETITTNSADIAFLYIDPQTNDLFICESPRVIKKNQNGLMSPNIIKKGDFHEIGNQSTITADGKLVTQSGNRIKYVPLVYIPDISQAKGIIVDNSILKNDTGTMLKNTTSYIASITGQFAGALLGTTNFAKDIMNTYNTLTTLPKIDKIKRQISELETRNDMIDLEIEEIEKRISDIELEQSDAWNTSNAQSDSGELGEEQILLTQKRIDLKKEKIKNEGKIQALKQSINAQ